MNKKMRELLNKIRTITAEARKKQDDGDIAGATELLNQVTEMRAEYGNEKMLYEAEKDSVPDDPKPSNEVSGFTVMAKLAIGKRLTEAENALVSGGTDGENFLVPEDVDTTIRELRKTYVSAKDLITVIPTTALSGSYTFESGAPAGLTPFEDNGDEIEEETNPTFVQKKWAIKFKGKIFPVSNILLGAEKAGLMSYLNNWFVKSAIISENKDIFAALKDGKTAKTLKGLDALKTSITADLDPSALIGGVIVTNQTGFNIMDSETDAVGRPILERDMKTPTQKLFQGLPIKVFPDAQLSNVSAGKAPIFYGSLTAGAFMIDKEGLEFATSEHVFFKKNQLAMRIIEGYDVIQADTDAYCYGTLTAADPKAITTKASA